MRMSHDRSGGFLCPCISAVAAATCGGNDNNKQQANVYYKLAVLKRKAEAGLLVMTTVWLCEPRSHERS